jgi:hypothetical protein
MKLRKSCLRVATNCSGEGKIEDSEDRSIDVEDDDDDDDDDEDEDDDDEDEQPFKKERVMPSSSSSLVASDPLCSLVVSLSIEDLYVVFA